MRPLNPCSYTSLHSLTVNSFRESSGTLSKTGWSQVGWCLCRVGDAPLCISRSCALCIIQSPCLKKKKNLPKNTSYLTSPKSSLRKSSLPHIDIFLKKTKPLHHPATLMKDRPRPSIPEIHYRIPSFRSRIRTEQAVEGWGLRRIFFFLVKGNRLHSWILCHVINKTKHIAFLPKHMALFLKHRSGLSWNSVFVSVPIFLVTWDLL